MLTYSSVPGPLRQFSWERLPLQRGKAVFRESDPAGHIYLLESGLVKLSRNVDSHRKTIIRLVHPGEMIGDRSLGAGGRHRYTAEALSDGSVWRLSYLDFQLGCDTTPAAINWVAEQVEQRLADIERRMESILYARVEVRILSLLVELAETTIKAEGVPAESVAIPLSQSEIAQLIGATRETASTTLNQLERRGLLRLSRRQIEVSSLDALRSAVTPDGDRAAKAHA